jgi:hypothetical protein
MKTLQFVFMGFLTWLLTNLIAAMLYLTAANMGVRFDPFLCDECYGMLYYVILFGLVFSAPFSIFIPLIFAGLGRIVDPKKRLTAGVLLISCICAIVIVTFISLFGTDGYLTITIVTFLLPYVFAAMASFMVIGRKVFFSKGTSINTHPTFSDYES